MLPHWMPAYAGMTVDEPSHAIVILAQARIQVRPAR